MLGVVHSCVSLPLQEALRHDRSNLLQKELHNKEQELEKILYRQKKVMGSKSFLTKRIPSSVFLMSHFLMENGVQLLRVGTR